MLTYIWSCEYFSGVLSRSLEKAGAKGRMSSLNFIKTTVVSTLTRSWASIFLLHRTLNILFPEVFLPFCCKCWVWPCIYPAFRSPGSMLVFSFELMRKLNPWVVFITAENNGCLHSLLPPANKDRFLAEAILLMMWCCFIPCVLE